MLNLRSNENKFVTLLTLPRFNICRNRFYFHSHRTLASSLAAAEIRFCSILMNHCTTSTTITTPPRLFYRRYRKQWTAESKFSTIIFQLEKKKTKPTRTHTRRVVTLPQRSDKRREPWDKIERDRPIRELILCMRAKKFHAQTLPFLACTVIIDKHGTL